MLVAGLILAAAIRWSERSRATLRAWWTKKIVLYEEGFLNWMKPEPRQCTGSGRPGMYGMLPVFLKSLGATVVRTAELSEAELADANVLMVIFPDKPWKDGQLDRIRQFVDRWRHALDLGEHTILDLGLLKAQDHELGTQLASLYDKLKPLHDRRGARRHPRGLSGTHRPGGGTETAIRRWRSATSLSRCRPEGTAQSLQRVARRYRHGGSLRLGAVRGRRLASVVSATVASDVVWNRRREQRIRRCDRGVGRRALAARGPLAGQSAFARRLGMGRPGDALNYNSFMSPNDPLTHEPRYDAGERLGDMVLAAEQTVGQGRVWCCSAIRRVSPTA